MVRAERNVRMVSLDVRDHALLLSLLEHKVLTTNQIKNLYFRSFRRCQHRMKELKDLGLVSSFMVGRGFGEGRPPACFILMKPGLAEIADARDVRVSDLPWVPDHSYRGSHMLAHRLGVNAFFCALAEASRDHEGHCLATWRPEHWVRTKAAEVKPDGFGRYLHPGGACEFYLEYDRGSEAFGALACKLEGYLRLAAGWTKEQELLGFPNVVLIVPEGVRGAQVGSAFRHAIGMVHARGSLATSFPLYVASEEQLIELGVLGPVWQHLPTHAERISLLELPAQPRDLHRPTRCLGRYFIDVGHRRRISPVSTTPRFLALPPRHAP
jgi:Replication-relaxation